jgi:release factor glutamine methyltransferase
MTVLQAIRHGVDFLAKKGVESPRLHAELLLAHVLQVPRMKLYLDFERVLTEEQQAALRELLMRRGRREPLQHILGSACFCGLDLAVNRDVLIPRPETELLAESGWQFLQRAAERPDSNPPRALDFGTGSGCLAIALAVHCPAARMVAIDISPAALALARQNAARHAVDSRIEFLPATVLPPCLTAPALTSSFPIRRTFPRATSPRLNPKSATTTRAWPSMAARTASISTAVLRAKPRIF